MPDERTGRPARADEEFVSDLRTQISTWRTAPVQVTLFGSAARGEMRAESDIDLLFIAEDDVGDDFFEDLADLAIRASALTQRDVRPLVYETSEVSPAPIFDSILRDGVHVFGDQNWLRQHISVQVAA